MSLIGSIIFSIIMTFLVIIAINQYTDYTVPIPFELPVIPIWAMVLLFIIAVIAIVYNRDNSKK